MSGHGAEMDAVRTVVLDALADLTSDNEWCEEATNAVVRALTSSRPTPSGAKS